MSIFKVFSLEQYERFKARFGEENAEKLNSAIKIQLDEQQQNKTILVYLYPSVWKEVGEFNIIISIHIWYMYFFSTIKEFVLEFDCLESLKEAKALLEFKLTKST